MVKSPLTYFLVASMSLVLLLSACASPQQVGTMGKLKASLPVDATITFE